MSEIKRFTYSSPYDDNKLVYDYDLHRYILNKNFISSRFPSYNKPVDDKSYYEILQEVSDNVYLYIYSHKTGIYEYDVMEYELARNQYYREWIAEALIRQFEYAATSSGDIVNKQHGVDINNNKVIEIESLRNELFVSYKTILILQQHGFLEMMSNSTDYTADKWRVDY